MSFPPHSHKNYFSIEHEVRLLLRVIFTRAFLKAQPAVYKTDRNTEIYFDIEL